MTTQEKFEFMTETPIKKLIPKLAVPTIISMLMTSAYNMADTYFVSHIGTEASAAVGVIFSLMAMIQAIGFTIGIGSGNFVSRLLGEKDYTTAERTVSTAFFTALITGALLGGGGLLITDKLTRFLGAIDSVRPYAVEYARWILIAAPLMESAFVLNNLLRAQGYAFYSMIGICCGGVLNIVLDPILIYVLKMGISGAAIATAVSQGVSCIVLLCFIEHTKGVIGVGFRKFRPSLRIYGEIIHSGLPSFCRQGIGSISGIVLNTVAGAFGASVLAAMAIVNKFMMFIYSALIGFSQGFQPVCGFNYGAKKYDRVLSSYRFCIIVAIVILSALGVLTFIFAPQIMAMFRADDAEVINVGAFAMRCQCVTLPLQAYIMMSQFFAQSIGFGYRASLIAMSRQGLFLIPLYIILTHYLGVTGLQISQTVSDFFTMILALLVARSTIKVLNEKKAQQC